MKLPSGVQVLTGRSSPFEEEVTFWPLAQMVYSQIGRDREAYEADVLEDLRDAVGSWVEPDEVDRAVHGLGLALGLDGDGDESSRYHAAEVRRGIFAMVSGLAAQGPVVLVFEDLQEADPLVLDLIQQLVKEARRLPLLVLCVARWEFIEREPTWAGGIADAVTLWVEPLAPGHAARLAEEAGGLDPTTPTGSPRTPAGTRSSSSRSRACCSAKSARCLPEGRNRASACSRPPCRP